MRSLRGACHCGNITVVLETSVNALSLRACQCSFCRKHGARNASDTNGELRVTVSDEGALVRYRFGLGVTDFLMCRTCGVYVAATMPSGPGILGTVNVNVLDDQGALPEAAEPMVYDGEGIPDRLARRARAWMPVTLGFGL